MASNIEPQTSAKCIVNTNKGSLNIELWAKECPVSSKKFLELCKSGEIRNWSFKSLSMDRDLLVLDEMDDKSLVSESALLAKEKNIRLKFNKGGMLAWNIQKNKLVFSTKELDVINKSRSLQSLILFGKLVDQTIYTLREICNSEVDDNDRFIYSVGVSSTEITVPYFDDLLKDSQVTLNKLNDQNNISNSDNINNKTKNTNKIQIIYDDEEEEEEDDDDDDDDDDNANMLPLKKKLKIKLPSNIHTTVSSDNNNNEKIQNTERNIAEGSLEILEDVSKPIESETPTLHSGTNLQKRASPIVSIEESGQTARELDTMKLLEQFQSNTSVKNIFKRNK